MSKKLLTLQTIDFRYLEDLMDIGIPQTATVRLGSKSSTRTEPSSMFKQQPGHLDPQVRAMYEQLQNHLDDLATEIAKRTTQSIFKVSDAEIMEFLEFSETHDRFFDAFTVPKEDDDMQIVGHDGKAIGQYYLLGRWLQGHDAGVLKGQVDGVLFRDIWEMEPSKRTTLDTQWRISILEERCASVVRLMHRFDEKYSSAQEIRNMRTNSVLKEKRIVGCTTTGAAMFNSQLQTAAPGIIIAEEAGEILESHVLTAMSEKTKQLVLIGDHKQLRPKINNFELTVEKGNGYNLNM
jgi:hypothetical protein